MNGWTEVPEAGWRMRAASWDRQGGCRAVDLADLKRNLDDPDNLVWYHIVITDEEKAEDALQTIFGFNSLAARDAVEWTPRPSLHDYRDHLFFSVFSVISTQPEETFREIAVFMSAHYMVTIVREDSPEVERWYDEWRKSPAEIGPHPAQLVHNLLDEIVDAYFPITDDIENDLDRLEEEIFEGEVGRNQQILALKWRLNALRRHVSPARDIANGLLSRNVQLIPAEYKVYMQDIYDHALRVLERIDLNRDMVSDLVGAHLSVVSNQLNQVMRVLTVVSTILMSMTLVAGIYGMNFKRMPELQWANGYPMALGLMAAIGFFGVWLFRKLDWL